MPQMSPLLWSLIMLMTISLLMILSSFFYFMYLPLPSSYFQYHTPSFLMFNWLW